MLALQQLYYDVANVLTTNSKPLRRQGNGTMLVAEGFLRLPRGRTAHQAPPTGKDTEPSLVYSPT